MEILAAVFIGLGLACCVIAVYGVYRMDYVLSRIHAAAVIDTLGVAFTLAGLLVSGVGMEYIPKLVCILLILWVGSPIASHLVSRMEYLTDEDAKNHFREEDRT